MADAGYYGITVSVNEALDRTITIQDVAGNAMNLTNHTARCDVADLASNRVLRMGSAPGLGEGTLVLGGSAGTVRFSASQSLVGAMGEGSFIYDLLILDANSLPARKVKGMFVVVPGATS